MNEVYSSLPSAEREAARARFARQIVARLEHDTQHLQGDISERLRFAREQALERAELARFRRASFTRFSLAGAGASIWGASSGWWLKLASIAPLVALAGGLLLIQQLQTRTQISVAAEVDAALLADDLPPTAYRDPGFFEFLKTPQE